MIKVIEETAASQTHSCFSRYNQTTATFFPIDLITIIITFISIAQIQQFSFQMRFTIQEEIKSTLPKSLFLQSLFTNQIKCWFLMRGENRRSRGKTSHSRVENQQTQSTYDTGCGNRTRATLVEDKFSHH